MCQLSNTDNNRSSRIVCTYVPCVYVRMYRVCMYVCTVCVCTYVPCVYVRMYRVCMYLCTLCVCTYASEVKNFWQDSNVVVVANTNTIVYTANRH